MKKLKLKKEDIIHLAKLAGLTLNQKEIEKFQTQLTETLQYIKNLNELDTSNMMETTSAITQFNVYFSDGEKNKKGMNLEEIFLNVEKRKDNYFSTKKIF
jgi:aspartyl-tRNA(Asn)/glutamyl-tRNA(Gln) amidotransferase subunit C